MNTFAASCRETEVIAGTALPSVGTSVDFGQAIVTAKAANPKGWLVGTPAGATGIAENSGQTDTNDRTRSTEGNLFF